MGQDKSLRVEVSSNGGFYIGDVCYVLPRSIYHGIWQDKYGFSAGLVKVSDDEPGGSFAVASTSYGDGVYWDEQGNEYPVDAGVIGLVPMELATEYEERADFKPGLLVGAPGTAVFEAAYGVFDITLPDGEKIHINTRSWDETDDENDEQEDEES